MTRIPIRSALIVLLAIAALTSTAGQVGPPLAASTHETPPPGTLASALAERLAPKGVRVIVQGQVTLDFWWVKALPIEGGANPSWTDVPEGSLLGAVNIPADFRDIRGRVIKPGVYTLRYGIQPQNGDHLGVSPFSDFLLLSPAASDKEPAPKGHEGTIEMSKGSVGGSHPGVWSIDPPAATAPALQPHKTELGHDAVIMEVPVARQGKPVGALRFGVVLIGKIEA